MPPELLHRVIQRESGYNPAARNGPYYGLMQILPETARTMGFQGQPDDLLDAETNLRWAGAYLSGRVDRVERRHRRGGPVVRAGLLLRGAQPLPPRRDGAPGQRGPLLGSGSVQPVAALGGGRLDPPVRRGRMCDARRLTDQQRARLVPVVRRSHGPSRVQGRGVPAGVMIVGRNGLR